ncbi:hypothetical protein ACU686_44695 [Yinghuangia aomiensis]
MSTFRTATYRAATDAAGDLTAYAIHQRTGVDQTVLSSDVRGRTMPSIRTLRARRALRARDR